MGLCSRKRRETSSPRIRGTSASRSVFRSCDRSNLRRPHELTWSVAQEQIVGLVADVVVYDFEDNDWGY